MAYLWGSREEAFAVTTPLHIGEFVVSMCPSWFISFRLL